MWSGQQEGVALLEFALCLPLFLAVIYGMWTLASLVRATYQVAVIEHAVMREAVAGTTKPATLTALARGYARAVGARTLAEEDEERMVRFRSRPIRSKAELLRMRGKLIKSRRQLAQLGKQPERGLRWRPRLEVTVEPSFGGVFGSLAAELAAGHRVTVRALVPVSGPLARLWPDGLPVEYSSVVLLGTWKGSLLYHLKRMFGGRRR